MIQVRIHCRGGQGVVTAAELLSVAAFLDGRHAQAFPSFGSERTGAPVTAFCRIDERPIRLPVRRLPSVSGDASGWNTATRAVGSSSGRRAFRSTSCSAGCRRRHPRHPARRRRDFPPVGVSSAADGRTRSAQRRLRRSTSSRKAAELSRAHPFPGQAPPIAIAHRGGAGDAPENTLEAFGAAVALGYRYLETDAHLTRDGVLVAFHDDRLDRVTDRRGAIAELGIGEVEEADAGHGFSTDGGRTFPFRGRGVRVPRLEQVLSRWPDCRVNIDPKGDACVAPVVALIDRLGAWDRVCVGSFSDRRLRQVRRLSRGRACTSMGPLAVATARLVAASGSMPRMGADCIQVPLRHGRITIVTPQFVRAAHRAGLPVHIWTVDDEPAIRRLLDLGVDGIMTNRLRLLRDVFADRGIAL